MGDVIGLPDKYLWDLKKFEQKLRDSIPIEDPEIKERIIIKGIELMKEYGHNPLNRFGFQIEPELTPDQKKQLMDAIGDAQQKWKEKFDDLITVALDLQFDLIKLEKRIEELSE